MSSSLILSCHRYVVCCLLAGMLAACGHEQVRQLPSTIGASGNHAAVPKTRGRSPGEQAALVAVQQIGVPYRYGGSTSRGFDCSGLVQFAYSNAGKRIPRTTSEQWRQLRPVSSNNLRVGDLLFFRIEGKVSHVGMYLGHRRFVHAPSTGREVSTASLDSDFYRRAFVRAARPE
jgi:cell wall-associated NlpC family hydrolase